MKTELKAAGFNDQYGVNLEITLKSDCKTPLNPVLG